MTDVGRERERTSAERGWILRLRLGSLVSRGVDGVERVRLKVVGGGVDGG